LENPLFSALPEKVRFSLIKETENIKGHPAAFIFSGNRPAYRDPPALARQLDQEWLNLRASLQADKEIPLIEIFSPSSPFTLTSIENLSRLQENLPGESPSVLLDLCVAEIIRTILSENHPPVSPQLFVELLNFYNERSPELLILSSPLFRIILEEQPVLRQEIKTRSCAVLINHFEIEALFVFIAGHPGVAEREKEILFQSLSAFQKIYRKFLELQEEIGNKDAISRQWFGEDFDRLKKSPAFQDSFPVLVQRFLEAAGAEREVESLSLGRYLVLRFNNEDILRQLYLLMQRETAEGRTLPQSVVYRRIYAIMQDFRSRYIPQKVDAVLTQTLSEMENQAEESMRLVTVDRVPAQLILQGFSTEDRPQHPRYVLQRSLAEKLGQYRLTFLYDLYPLPPSSQEVLYTVSRIAESLELQKEDLIRFIAYLERLLIFLQQLEEMGIRILPDARYGLILNPFQLNSFSLIEEGAYFASTGYWLRSRVPPAVIRCISPRAIPNCLGILDRHIFSRISLLTGAYRGTPFDLDSTNRYDWDEEPESCQIRPGYCLLDIPARLTRTWGSTQALQQEALRERIRKKEWS
jgi:hypothetical protein